MGSDGPSRYIIDILSLLLLLYVSGSDSMVNVY